MNTAALASAPTLEALYPLLAERSIGAGWNKPEPAMWPQPKKNFVPFHWRYADAAAAFESASRLVSTEQAERRNLILVNPIPGNIYSTLRTIVVAYQTILPGETARSHRHSPNALRLVLDAGGGAFTTVNAKKIPMTEGDVVLTPSGSWHGHGHDGDRPATWLDYLDVPLVQLLEPIFFDSHPAGIEKPERVTPESPFIFPFAKTEARLADAPADAQFGRQVELGGPALRTMGLFMMRLAPGAQTAPLRTTANNVYTVVRGEGSTTVDGVTFRWQRGDVIAAPAWRSHHHSASKDSVLFRVTDAPVMSALGLLREE
ncbi:MAG: cupin domain-containing protein [Proteobacteria bacterium]|nr:cupin domain-containing protein [Pseudomonadota bacterium]